MRRQNDTWEIGDGKGNNVLKRSIRDFKFGSFTCPAMPSRGDSECQVVANTVDWQHRIAIVTNHLKTSKAVMTLPYSLFNNLKQLFAEGRVNQILKRSTFSLRVGLAIAHIVRMKVADDPGLQCPQPDYLLLLLKPTKAARATHLLSFCGESILCDTIHCLAC